MCVLFMMFFLSENVVNFRAVEFYQWRGKNIAVFHNLKYLLITSTFRSIKFLIYEKTILILHIF